jgi:hypothetical protein
VLNTRDKFLKFMAKTELIIRVVIDHDTPKTKHQGLNIWCDGLKEGQNIRGHNGNGESYELTVKSIKDVLVK